MENKIVNVKELVLEWQEVHCKNLADSTVLGYNKYIKKYIIPLIGDKKIESVKQQDIQIMVNYLSDQGKSQKTQKNLLGILHAIFDYAFINKKIQLNPVKQIVTKKTAPYEYYIYSNSEFEKLITVFKGTIDIIPVLLGGVCGMRLSEIFGLTWGDIDFNKKTIKINKAAIDINGKMILKSTTKTVAGNRIISVPEWILEIIGIFRRNDKMSIYPSENNALMPANSHNFYQRYVRRIEEAGLPHTRFHDLRHFAATQFLDAGAPDKYVAAYLGHADTNMTKKYQHIRQQIIPFPLSNDTPKTNKKFDND